PRHPPACSVGPACQHQPLGAFPRARVPERPVLSRSHSSSSSKMRLDSKVPFQPPVLERPM
ncbi:unnamed protein product, partial [Gulo gulo]